MWILRVLCSHRSTTLQIWYHWNGNFLNFFNIMIIWSVSWTGDVFCRFPWQQYSFSIWQTLSNDFYSISLYEMLWHYASPQLYGMVTWLLFCYKNRFKWSCGCHGNHYPNIIAFFMNLLALLYLEISYYPIKYNPLHLFRYTRTHLLRI